MSVSLRDLQVFLAVVRAGSFGGGGAELGLSQPTVSERIARLERQIGVTLFTRSGRGVTLTAAGYRLLPYAQRCTALVDEALVATQTDAGKGEVRIAMHATFATMTMPRVVDAITPLGADVSCTDAHTDQVLTMLAGNQVDIGFVVPWPHPPQITVEAFLDDPVICVVRRDHPLADSHRLRMSDLAAWPVACNAWGDGAREFLTTLRTAPFPRRGLHTVSPADTVARLAGNGRHIGVLTRSTVSDELASRNLVELPITDLPHWQVTLALAYRTNDIDTDHVRALREAFIDPSSRCGSRDGLPARELGSNISSKPTSTASFAIWTTSNHS